ncbi:MAG: UDPglucose 6-dehydrogenase [Actinomycetota bacterium]|jgi:UDPglucose 6-dehydrogenase|nr:UDPglucose 6-dehydrogenase [Actinomycetota bacterium]
MKIGVVGTGHVGLVSCATFAALGHDVVGIDNDQEKIDKLRNGQSPFFEPGLDELVAKGTASGHLIFSTEMADAVKDSEVVFICVGTPPKASGEANLAAVEAAARDVAKHANQRLVVVEKSTVPAGTSNRLQTTLKRQRPDLQLEVASNPEFLREGKGVEDSMSPERILVGADSDFAFDVLRRVYEPLTAKGHLLLETDITTAEISKHACNAFLSMKISFANALARLCEASGGDVVKVTEVMGTDKRIGPQFLNAGIGYGGYCFPKDLQAFERLAQSLGYEFPLLREVANINDEAVAAAAKKVEDVLWNLDGKRVALFGLAFKPATDDVRLSPALALARLLLDKGAVIVGYDPQAGPNAKAEMPELEVVEDPFDAATGAHCVVITTEWPEIADLDLPRLKQVMAEPVIVDGRNVFDPSQMAGTGFTYIPTGRPPVVP